MNLKYIDYVIKFTNQTDRTNELMLVCLNLMKEDSWHVHCIGSIPSPLDMRCVGDSGVRFPSCQFLSNV